LAEYAGAAGVTGLLDGGGAAPARSCGPIGERTVSEEPNDERAPAADRPAADPPDGRREAALADRVLAVLYDRAEGYVALDELAAAVDADRAGVDRALARLRQRGQAVEALPVGGVRLVRPIRLDPRLIERDLGTRRVGRSVLCFDEVDSTNDVALSAARRPESDGLVVLAESQRRGRGRHGRQWLSPPGRNVLLSALLIEPEGTDAAPHGALTIAAGLAVAEAVKRTTVLSCSLRWPNDVLLEGEKVAGVLVELRRVGRGLAVVIGIGVNVNAAPPTDAVAAPATCLADHLGQPVERTELVRSLLRRLDEWADRVKQARWQVVHEAFLARCCMVGQRITVLCDGRHHTGRVLDVDPLAGLVLCRDDGSRAHLPAERSTVIG
jgi:BirA family biotin operon repressor/biotin-[acetyl-CoA-carboxylase] ligase